MGNSGLAFILTRLADCYKSFYLLCRHVESNRDHWHPAPMMVVTEVEDMNKVKISMWLQHRLNFQQAGQRAIRRAQLIEEMIRAFKDLGIEYRMLPLDVNVRNMPTLASNRLPSNWTACANGI